jgi:hypothetical protein
MQDIEVTLPGGLLKNGKLERRALFRPINGKTELALIELEQGLVLPSYVSSVLLLVLDSIGSHAIDVDCVNSLCMGDRQFLMLRLAERLSGDQVWLKATCGQCTSPFDVELRRCELPVKMASRQFPSIKLNLQAGEVEVRVPTAFDQMGIVNMSEAQAIQELLKRCIESVDGKPPGEAFVRELSEDDISTIDQALDELSPAICNELLVVCPECDKEQSIKLDHYNLTALRGGTFYNEIHTIAMYYHWGEEEILNMPRARRRRYIDLIDRSRSMMRQVQ